jgi:mRNA-degrading endonuclease toxin of MazEF toxin-antitoxin module
MLYKKGDVVSISPGFGDSELELAVIIQADWFNVGKPPTYMVCCFSSKVYPELDFRPIIKPDGKNNLSVTSQIMIDRVQTIKSDQISKRIGEIGKSNIKEINGCLKAILEL